MQSWLNQVTGFGRRHGYAPDWEAHLGCHLVVAFTHRTYAHEAMQGQRGDEARPQISDNQRLEFLGDAVIGFVVAERLMKLDGEATEGELSRKRATLINADTLATVAEREGLEDLLRLGRGEPNMGGAARRARLADLTEAVIGALYLDLGIKKTSELIWLWVAPSLARSTTAHIEVSDPKTALQHEVHKRFHETPVYQQTNHESGGIHAEVWVGSRLIGSGRGETKRIAQREAAKNGLERLKSE